MNTKPEIEIHTIFGVVEPHTLKPSLANVTVRFRTNTTTTGACRKAEVSQQICARNQCPIWFAKFCFPLHKPAASMQFHEGFSFMIGLCRWTCHQHMQFSHTGQHCRASPACPARHLQLGCRPLIATVFWYVLPLPWHLRRFRNMISTSSTSYQPVSLRTVEYNIPTAMEVRPRRALDIGDILSSKLCKFETQDLWMIGRRPPATLKCNTFC